MLRGHQWNHDKCTFKVYYIDTGTFKREWEAKCSHYLSDGSLVALPDPSSSTQDVPLIEGCPQQGCEVLRVYYARKTKFQNTRIVYENIKPHKMCLGPDGSLLVCDERTRDLLQLSRTTDQTFRLVSQTRLLGCHAVHGMTYVQSEDLVIMTLKHSKKIVAIKLKTGAFAWQRSEHLDGIPLSPEEVCITSDEWICVANGNNLLTLDATDGSYLVTLLQDETVTNIQKVTWTNENGTPRLAIRHGALADQITCFNDNVTFKCNHFECPLRPREHCLL